MADSLELEYASQFVDDIKSDGSTFTVTMSPWCDAPIKGIPTREMAEQICMMATIAMRAYADNALIED